MRLIIYRKDTIRTCCCGVVAIEFLARTAVDNDSAVVHVVGPSAPAAFGLAIGGHGKEVAGPIVVLVAVGALGIVGIEHRRIAEQTEAYDHSALVVYAKDGEALLFHGGHGLTTALTMTVGEGEVVA